MRNKVTIKITLQSDLCVGSGYSYAGLIDTDICYDEYGVPYIPAKRIKGCMRETAENLLYSIISAEKVQQIFGRRGADNVQGIILDNAYPEGYLSVKEKIPDYLNNNDIKKLFTRQNVLDCFTSIKAQTRIDEETGVARDLTLRYTRAVNKYSPITNEPLVFTMDMYYDEYYKEELLQIISGTRNIGLNRNRGLGCIRMEWIPEAYNKKTDDEKISHTEYEDEEIYEIKYYLTNIEPLILSNKDDRGTEQYISGQAVLGMFADAYINDGRGGNCESEEFTNLFLDGSTRYTNLYLYRNGKEYYPAPLFINRLKKTKNLVNVYLSSENESIIQSRDGNLPKKINGKWVSLDKDEEGKLTKCDVQEVVTDIVYHNHKNSDEKDKQLYYMQAVRENQKFYGSIFVKGKYVKLIEKLLDNADIRFGKSRTAQYGKCVAIHENPQKSKEKEIKILGNHLGNGNESEKCSETIAVTLLSDGVFVKNNNYTVYYDDVYNIIAEQLKIKQYLVDEKNDIVSEKSVYSMVQTKEIYGYNTKWNLRKSPVSAVAAGSTFVYKLSLPDDGITMFYDSIGEKNHEGYGRINIYPLSEMEYNITDLENDKDETKKISEDFIKKLIERIKEKNVREQIKYNICKDAKLINISASTLGRVSMMLKESIEENPGDKEKAFKDFYDRVNSIKRKKEKETILKELIDIIGWYEKRDDMDDIVSLDCKKIERIIGDGQNISDDEEQLLKDKWDYIVMTKLIWNKYQMKINAKEDRGDEK